MDIVGTFGGLIAAHICLTIPWTLRLTTAGLTNLDTTIEEAARNLGASAWTTFRRITLPALRPALIASFLFSFIVSFENLEVSLPLVGAGHTTLPIALCIPRIQFGPDDRRGRISAVLLLGIVMRSPIVSSSSVRWYEDMATVALKKLCVKSTSTAVPSPSAISRWKLPKAKWWLFFGPSGCGKTTTCG